MEQGLVILLVKLVVAASLASLLARSSRFQNLLLREERDVLQRVHLALGISGFCAAGGVLRVLTGTYVGADLSLEGAMLAGMLGGYVPGLLSGVLISAPAMAAQEFLSMPVYAAAGVMGGLLRDIAADPNEIWRFSPFFDVSLWRIVRHPEQRRRSAFHLLVLTTILLAEFLRHAVLQLFQARNVFALYADWKDVHPALYAAAYATTAFAISIPIKIWNSARNERLLEMKERLLAEARLSALSSRINPHFLFNTLNTVSSLIRTNPEKARRVVYQLARILRRLLRKTDGFLPLKDEMSFIEDYLAIEMARFGDKLRFEKEIEPETMELAVPSMILQPIVENSIKHGISRKVEGGLIRIASRRAGGRLVLKIEDDGMGMDEDRLAGLLSSGIGVSNVNERLQVLFGSNYRLTVDSRPGDGTRTEVELPLPPPADSGSQ
jgi:two-component system LytT family sensor kinase